MLILARQSHNNLPLAFCDFSYYLLNCSLTICSWPVGDAPPGIVGYDAIAEADEESSNTGCVKDNYGQNTRGTVYVHFMQMRVMRRVHNKLSVSKKPAHIICVDS